MNYKRLFGLQLLLSGLIITAILINGYSIINDRVKEITVLEQLDLKSDYFKKNLETLKNENSQLKKSLLTIGPEKATENLLMFFAEQNQNISLYKMEKAKVFSIDNLKLFEMKFILKGRFKALLICLNDLEKQADLGQISYLEIERRRVSKTQFELYSSLVIHVLSQDYND